MIFSMTETHLETTEIISFSRNTLNNTILLSQKFSETHEQYCRNSKYYGGRIHRFNELGSGRGQGLNCQKISGGLTSAYSLSLSLHTRDSASLTTAGVETDPQGISGHLVWGGVEQTTGGFNPPNPPGNSNTGKGVGTGWGGEEGQVKKGREGREWICREGEERMGHGKREKGEDRLKGKSVGCEGCTHRVPLVVVIGNKYNNRYPAGKIYIVQISPSCSLIAFSWSCQPGSRSSCLIQLSEINCQ
jgi:hypothetical protein